MPKEKNITAQTKGNLELVTTDTNNAKVVVKRSKANVQKKTTVKVKSTDTASEVKAKLQVEPASTVESSVDATSGNTEQKMETLLTVDSTVQNESTQNIDFTGEFINEIPIADLHPPEFHPFQVNDDEAMTRLAESIREYGVREPGLARPRFDKSGNPNGFELLCGNRRKRACQLAEKTYMPVIIRELDDDNAVIAMVDSNLEQREQLLFSERAWAYRIKMEALNHKGIKSENGKTSTEILVEQTGESKNQIFRLIRLTELVIGLIDKVDTKQLAFNPAVELSYLSQKEQALVISAMEEHDIKPSLSQAVRLRKLKQEGKLTDDTINGVLAESKQKSSSADKEVKRYRKYFPSDYTPKQINKVITDLLKAWQSDNLSQSTNIAESKNVALAPNLIMQSVVGKDLGNAISKPDFSIEFLPTAETSEAVNHTANAEEVQADDATNKSVNFIATIAETADIQENEALAIGGAVNE